MNTATFLEKFDLIAEIPNAVEKIRELILRLAVSGKLVAQDKMAEPAESLLRSVETERTKLSVARKIKSRQALPVATGEQPFKVPQSWAWARLSEVGHELGQKIPETRFTYIDVGAIDSDKGCISPKVEQLEPNEAPSRARKILRRGTVIYSTVRPYLRNIAIVEKEFQPEPIASTAFGILHPFSGINNRYLFYWLRSGYFTSYVERGMKGMAYPAINDEKFYNGYIPIPPLEEQKRIVARVDELMALCDQLEARQKERDEKHKALCRAALSRFSEDPTPANLEYLFHPSFKIPPDDLRKTILTLAVQGKLVEQDSDEGSGSELVARIAKKRHLKIVKPYSLISDSELPVKVPFNWVKVRLGNITISSDSGWSPQCLQEARSGTNWGVLKVSAVSWGSYKAEENKALPPGILGREECEVKAGDFLISRANTEELVGKSAVVEETKPRLMMSDKIVRFKFFDEIDPFFINIVNLSGISRAYYAHHASGTSSSMKNISREVMLNLPIALPPLLEQRRIISKVNQLMKLIADVEENNMLIHCVSAKILSFIII